MNLRKGIQMSKEIKCPQCREVMEQFEGDVGDNGKPEKLFYCNKGHGTWCDYTIKLYYAIQRNKEKGVEFLYCDKCKTRHFGVCK